MRSKYKSLDEAMLAGLSKVHNQAYNTYYSYDINGKVKAVCALGAALYAEGVRTPNIDKLMDRFPEFTECKSTSCPECNRYYGSRGTDVPLRNCITHLNDHHIWTIEEIADWVKDKPWRKMNASVLS